MYDLAIIGGGAAGFFAAAQVRQARPNARIILLEAGAKFLSKVKISGGGRCNITNRETRAKVLAEGYPRGQKFLQGPFRHFGAKETRAWFEAQGVATKIEEDGRVFPVSDRSQSVIDALQAATTAQNVEARLHHRVHGLAWHNDHWRLDLGPKPSLKSQRVFVASGSNHQVWSILAALGHQVVDPVPSLFAFDLDRQDLPPCPGVSVPLARVQLVGPASPPQQGPMLVTHRGLSGPAILRLSAWQAKSLCQQNYRGELQCDWLSNQPYEHSDAELRHWTERQGKRQLQSRAPFAHIPNRLWLWLLVRSQIDPQSRWAELSKKKRKVLLNNLHRQVLRFIGKTTNKEEFVTAGGIDLKHIDPHRFQSRVAPNLWMAGEVLNIDGITGGYNFQAAWTGAALAAKSIVESLHQAR